MWYITHLKIFSTELMKFNNMQHNFKIHIINKTCYNHLHTMHTYGNLKYLTTDQHNKNARKKWRTLPANNKQKPRYLLHNFLLIPEENLWGKMVQIFLQARCSSFTQSTVPKHWRELARKRVRIINASKNVIHMHFCQLNYMNNSSQPLQ